MDNLFDILEKKKDKEEKKKPNKNIHSEVHYWADVISTAYGEKNRFGMYLGIIKRIGPKEAARIFSELKQSNCHTPAKLFLWKTSKKNYEKPATDSTDLNGLPKNNKV